MAVELSHAIDLFLHKNRASFFDDDSVIAGTVPSLDSGPALASQTFRWDLQTTCKPMLPAFQYISGKLSERGLQVHLIISDYEPYVIPVWSLPRTSQLILAKIVRKARSKFNLSPSFLTALASHSNKKDLPKIFHTYRPDSYIVRRSIVQQEMIFSEEGLALLSIDHIYTFKQLLCTLSKKDWVPCAREVCLSSCVHLLHRMNQIYTNPKVSRGYIARVYKELEFHKETYEEVCSAYTVNFCTASIKDVTTLEPDYSALADIDLDWDDSSPSTAELPDTSTSNPRNTSSDLISPIATVDLSTIQTWETKSQQEPKIPRPVTYTYPAIRKPTEVPESPLEHRELWDTQIPRSLNTKANTISEVLLSPLDQTELEPWGSTVPRRLNTTATWTSDVSLSPLDEALAEAWEIGVPVALDEAEAEEWNPDEEATRDIIESWMCDVPAPLKTTESGSSDGQKSPLEYVKAWVESWSTVAPDRVCAKCQDTVVIPRRVTVA
ncbi:hypothetical protein OEA41_008228 [Lepraria neglecta]|uniref:DUF7582 domain-containing protein n=1 Tax=Lepraria neglecta TaxID=209136 RepID=A0AAD9ZEB2_9LECA|nr:hypothetical protein OEA41_008228 [Lepraria neglecta]